MTRTHILLALAAWVVLALPARAVSPSGAPVPEAIAESAEAAFPGTPLGAADVPESEAVAVDGRAGLPLPVPVAFLGEDEDDPEVSQEVAAESAELDELRDAEEHAALVPPPPAAATAVEDDGERIPLLPQIPHGLARLQAKYDIPIDVNESVVAYIRFFQTEPARKHFVRWLGRLARYDGRYRAILKEEGLPEDTIFLAMIESGFANLATSRARAVGPWQFIAGTGKRMGLKQDFWVDERRDPEKAARAAAAYLRELYGEFGDWRLAWAGYNAGGGKIMKAQRKGQTDFWSMARGRVLKKETKGYVPKLMAAAIVSKHPEAFGFRAGEIQAEAWRSYERVEIAEAAELSAVAGAAGVPVSELHELNPELRRSCTPPRPYALRLPAGTAGTFQENWRAVAPSARLGFAHHVVARGDSLSAIAAAYGVPVAAVLRMNGMTAPRRVRPGTELVIPLSAAVRKSGAAPATEAVARARIQELQQRDPRLVEPEPAAPRAAVARVEQVDGRTRATVLVQAGDSLWAISQKFGVRIDELCRWNGIQNPRRHKLQVGRELVVFTAGLPPGASGSAAFVPGAGPG